MKQDCSMQLKDIFCIRYKEASNRGSGQCSGTILNYALQGNPDSNATVYHLQHNYAELTFFVVSFLFTCRAVVMKMV